MPETKKPRIVLQFNEYDFRHKKALEILRNRPRRMTELVVNALLHYVICPEGASEMSKDWVRGIVKEELAGIQGGIPINGGNGGSSMQEEDMADLGNVMGMFRRGD